MTHSTNHNLHAAPLPDLRIVPLGKLLPHELHDNQRATPLIHRLAEEGLLRNPPIVTPAGARDDRYVILDGANRAVALDVLGIGHVLVQVVPYREPDVELLTWYHVVSGLTGPELAGLLNALPGIEASPTDIYHARGLLGARMILAYYLLPDRRVITLAGGGLDVQQRTRLLQEIVDCYLNRARLIRTSTDDIDEMLALYPEMGGAVIFPRYDPAEILDLAQKGLRVPAGITRHVIRGRALRLNYPLERLAARTSLEAKNHDLQDWIKEKYEARAVRFYAEATYLFDE